MGSGTEPHCKSNLVHFSLKISSDCTNFSHNDVLSSRKHQFYQKVQLSKSSPRMEEDITNEKLLVPGIKMFNWETLVSQFFQQKYALATAHIVLSHGLSRLASCKDCKPAVRDSKPRLWSLGMCTFCHEPQATQLIVSSPLESRGSIEHCFFKVMAQSYNNNEWWKCTVYSIRCIAFHAVHVYKHTT